VKIPVQAHSNPTFDVEKDEETFRSAKALKEQAYYVSKCHLLLREAKRIHGDTKEYCNGVKKQEGGGSIN
jgi:hypothetical protein